MSDYFLPHMSSDFFRTRSDQLNKNETPIPYEKWVINLSSLGNVGAASVYFMVDEVFKSDKLKAGQKVLLLVPESSRFSYMYALLTFFFLFLLLGSVTVLLPRAASIISRAWVTFMANGFSTSTALPALITSSAAS